MPRAPSKCIFNRCTNPSVFRGYCSQHQKPREPWKGSRERVFLHTKAWKLQRRRILYRDPNCMLQLPYDPTDPNDTGCTLVSTEVDHKLPVWYTGEEVVDDEDLQGVCHRCHSKKSSFEGVQAKKIKKYLREKDS